jgi:hypothetical protein
LMKLPPSRTWISILYFACKAIGTRISSSKLLFVFYLEFSVLRLSNETSGISVILNMSWYFVQANWAGLRVFGSRRDYGL